MNVKAQYRDCSWGVVRPCDAGVYSTDRVPWAMCAYSAVVPQAQYGAGRVQYGASRVQYMYGAQYGASRLSRVLSGASIVQCGASRVQYGA